MLLDQADVCKQAAMFESMKLKESIFHPAFMLELEALLLEVYASLLPSASEYVQRKQLVQSFNMTAKNIFGDTSGFQDVVAFGSFVMDIFTAKSDLDLSINFNSSDAACLPRVEAVSVLKRFAKVLKEERSKGHLSSVMFVQHARVPVLKAIDCKTGIECDISVQNKNAISRSLFYSIISSVERFRIMSYLMKAWAKANRINSSRYRTLNSVSIISLVALHFQTRDPPILPPFSTLLRDGTDITNLPNVVLELTEFAKRNRESVAELFVSLLAKLASVEKLWERGLCASNFEGSWISKTWSSKTGSFINVEDFLDRDQNFARAVAKSKMPVIYNCLRRSLGHLSSTMKGQIEFPALRTLLFKSISPHPQTNLADTLCNQKLTVKSSQVGVNAINQSNHSSSTARTKLKRKETSKESAQTNSTNITTGITWNMKPPGRNALNDNAPKRPRHNSTVAGAFPPGFHENQNYGYLPALMTHPSASYVPLPPLNGIGLPFVPAYHTPFPFHMGLGPNQLIQHPFTNFVPSSSQHQHALQYRPTAPDSSGMLRYFPNPGHPMSMDGRHLNILPGHAMHNSFLAGLPQHFVPPRSFRSNYP